MEPLFCVYTSPVVAKWFSSNKMPWYETTLFIHLIKISNKTSLDIHLPQSGDFLDMSVSSPVTTVPSPMKTPIR